MKQADTGRTPDQEHIVDLREVLDAPEVQALFDEVSQPIEVLVDEQHANAATRVALGLATGTELRSAILARTPHAGVCEILAVGAATTEDLGRLVDAAADHLHAVAIWATVGPERRVRWEPFGFVLRDHPARAGLFLAERRHPPEPEGFRTSATVRAVGERRIEVELPPEGNTLPLVPEALRDRELPAHVVRWIADADEVGLLLQDLVPQLFPPVTPAVRPASVRVALGSLAPVLGDPELDRLDPSDPVPGLPEGLQVPVRVVELLAAADRIRSWLVEAKRVRQWSEAEGAGAAAWITHDPWEPHTDMVPELDRPPDGRGSPP